MAGPAAPHWPPGNNGEEGSSARHQRPKTQGGMSKHEMNKAAMTAEMAAKMALEVPLSTKWGRYRAEVHVQTESQELVQVSETENPKLTNTHFTPVLAQNCLFTNE